MEAPHIQLILERQNVPLPLQTALGKLKARVSVRSLTKALDSGISPTADVCVILPDDQDNPEAIDNLINAASEQACASMVLPGRPSSQRNHEIDSPRLSSRRLSMETDELPELNSDELTGRIQALCEIRHPMKKMREELRQLRSQAQLTSRNPETIEEQIQLAGQIQNDLLPRIPIDISPLTVATMYLPADYVSGDIYDISRLDEDHFGFSLADATGHGIPAALLTFFVKNSFQGKEIIDGSYHIIEPDELLNRLNKDLLATHLQQCQFITAFYGLYNRTERRLRWARGGCPYPILLRPGQPPRQLRSTGGLIGAFENSSYEVSEHRFEPNDTLVIFTDGLESLLLSQETANSQNSILETDWLTVMQEQGPESAFAQLREHLAHHPVGFCEKDDVTVLALHMNE